MQNKTVVIYDGDCRFCNSSVLFIIKHEKNRELLFAHLQDPIIHNKLYELNNNDLKDSIYLYNNGDLHFYSTAALMISKHLKAPYSWMRILTIVPKFIRDWCYKLVAKNRKHLGLVDRESKSCILPTELEGRMINQL